MEGVRDALTEVGINGITVSEVKGFGRQKAHSDIYRGTEYSLDFIPKIKFEMVVPDELVRKVIQVICNTARTGKIGDGKVFVVGIEEAVRMRTGERGLVGAPIQGPTLAVGCS
jgi:nitrogen regulatory protein P-II 1